MQITPLHAAIERDHSIGHPLTDLNLYSLGIIGWRVPVQFTYEGS